MMPTTDAERGPGGGRGRAGDVDRYVGARLRERRLALGLTQQQVAELIGATGQQVHKYETGESRISAGRLHTLACALDVEPAYLFEGLGVATPSAGRRRPL